VRNGRLSSNPSARTGPSLESGKSALLAASRFDGSASCTSSRSPPLWVFSSAGEPVGFVEVLRRQQHRRAVRDQMLDRRPERDSAARVDAGRRFVEEQDSRARDHRRGEVEAPAHPARVGAHQPPACIAELELVQQLARPLARFAAAEVVEAPDHLEVLEAGQVVVDRCVLAGEPDALANLARMAEHVDAGDARRALVGLEERGEDPHRRRLPGAIWPEQPEHDPPLHAEVDAVERDDLAVPLA
jgi:hypothetical protein